MENSSKSALYLTNTSDLHSGTSKSSQSRLGTGARSLCSEIEARVIHHGYLLFTYGDLHNEKGQNKFLYKSWSKYSFHLSVRKTICLIRSHITCFSCMKHIKVILIPFRLASFNFSAVQNIINNPLSGLR